MQLRKCNATNVKSNHKTQCQKCWCYSADTFCYHQWLSSPKSQIKIGCNL